MIKFIFGFLQVLQIPPSIKLTAWHNITEILLKMTLNTISLTLTPYYYFTTE
jgi:hypothetical protein